MDGLLSHNGPDGQPMQTPNDVEYDSRVNQITIPSYASSPTSPQTPFSPRAMAIQQLKRAASVREAAGKREEQQQQPTQQHLSASDHGHSQTPYLSGTSSLASPSTGMSPSMSRAPSIKRLGLERSASDAARRMAMAKLTGEKVTAPPEFTMPKTPLPTGPLPTLADLQARHEQRFGLASPEPVPCTSSPSPPHGLSRNPSSASTALSRQLSTASARNGPSNLSRNPSVAHAGDGGSPSPALSASDHGMPDGTEDDVSKQRRTDERQEARSNLIRKLSRGRLAGAAAAANLKERHGKAGQAGAAANDTTSAQTSPELQRRPSLADVLAKAESRIQGRAQTPETPSRNAVSTQRQDHTPQQIQLATPDSATRAQDFSSPVSVASIVSGSPSASSLRRANLRQYDHIPVPPTPATGSTTASHSNTNSTSSTFSPNINSGGPASAHESIYSTMSNYRSYRHTMERDRDSAIARMQMEDAFEFDIAALEAARASVATTAFTAGNQKAKSHDRQLFSDDDRGDELEEELEDDRAAAPLEHRRQNLLESDHTLRQTDFTPISKSLQAQIPLGVLHPQFSAQQTGEPHHLQEPEPPFLNENHRRPSDSTEASSHSARNRAIGSMPQTPESLSPATPFAFSPAAGHLPVEDMTVQQVGSPESGPVTRQAEQHSTEASFTQDDRIEQSFPFLRHHQKEPNGDFPVSVISSRASTYPDNVTLPVNEQPPVPQITSLPVNLQAVFQDRNGMAHPSDPAPHDAVESSNRGTDGVSRYSGEAIRHEEHEDNAGPTSEYRFPTASSRGRRQDSLSSSNEHHDDNLNSMISQLEAMQAAGTSESPSQSSHSPSLRKQFGTRGLEQTNKTLPRQPHQQVFPPASPSAHQMHAAPHGQSEPKPLSLAHLASQFRQPPVQALGSPKLAQREMPAQNGRSTSKERAAAPEQATTRQPLRGGVGHVARESEAEVLDFAENRPAYNSGASAENDSAPSLARTGTGSSSSGFSTHSDNAFAVTSAVVPPGQTKEQVMSRLSDLLSTYRSHPTKKPTALNDPPRHLLLHSPVLQVVNSNTVKDRYLFLFSDILVIAKPIINDDAIGEPLVPSLDTKFLVKSIVELPKLKLTAQTADVGEDPVQKRKHPLLLTFVDRFANDPRKAVSALVAKAGLSNDPTTIANLLFRNPELNRSQLGGFLAHKDQKPVLKAYCDRFRLAGIRIEDALRVFIGSLRLPNDYTAAEYLLGVFASQWLASNPGTGMTNDGVFATKLVLSMMELNDALHSGIDDEATAAGNLFSFPNSAITVDDFIAAFRLKDPHGALPDEHLTRIYLSIRKDRLQQAADNSVISGIPEIEVIIHPSKLPNRLTYRTASENISLTIPKVDPKFAIKLVGQDLRFEPPVLTFARSRTATFRVTPTALGSKAMLFIRLGQNAHLYSSLPINKTFSVERAFMNHTFQIAFVNHLGVKRKYLFSLSNIEAKYRWVDTLRTRIENSPIEQADTPRPTRLSDAVSLQVLRDALIPPDEPAPVLANKSPYHPGRPGFSTPPTSRGRSAAGGGIGLQRSSSISKTYAHGQGKAEADLNDQRRPSGTNLSLLTPLTARRGSRDDEKAASQQQQQQHHKTGHELVTAVRQNSLMPLVLGFVGAAFEGLDALPRKPIYPQNIQSHVTPPQARGMGRFKNL